MNAEQFILFVLEDAVWSGLAALGFGMLFNVPKSALGWCALLGAMGHALRTALGVGAGLHVVPATLLACLVIGVGARWRAHVMKMPAKVFQVTSVIPLIPGAFAFRAMLGLFALAGMPIGSITEPLQYVATNIVMTGALLGAIVAGIIAPKLLITHNQPVV